VRLLRVGDLEMDAAAHSARLGGRELALSPREYDLLYTLAMDAGKVVTSSDLLSRVWGPEFVGEPQVLYVHVRWLREKIEPDPQNPRRLLTVRGVGYKLVEA
ncbi:MAG: winged helix-turn-helix transcriptional regulator, partial [Anaerolineae bacterium]|nr:winged helix-turn-helix transcriptional regulator [Anaerolineae bacterium]